MYSERLSDGFLSDENEDKNSRPLISQFAQEVLDYSSVYGTHGSISYSSVNICGRPCKFPSYGDFAECFSLRSYGPVLEREFSPKDTHDSVTFHDFVIVQFEDYVLPKEIKIYETYNPGSVVRILAYCCSIQRWEILWESQPQLVEKKAREFCPTLRQIQIPTRILRLEFNCSLLDYYTGIDALLLTGVKCSLPIPKPPSESKIILGLIQQKLETVQFMPQVAASDAIEEFLRNDLNKFIETVGLKEKGGRREKRISDIPDEVLYKILTLLDLRSLYNASQVNRKFYRLSKDPLLYTEVNLKKYWYRANAKLLKSLHNRCLLIRKLDMSSCGYFGTITSEDFMAFMKINGRTITHIRLNSTQFMNSNCLQTVAFKCQDLVELSIRNYSHVTTDREFICLSLLRKLEILDLSRSGIDTFALIKLIQVNPRIKHLYLSFNNQLGVDQICIQISESCKDIRTIDLWKCHNLTTAGLRALSNCKYLEVADFGWNLREESNITDSFKMFIQNCSNLKRMVLAAVRGIAERDLENVATFCNNLEHLDLMGIVGINSEAVLKILQQCQRLKMIDLSFCENLDDLTLFRWASEYNVCIKRSEVPNEF